MNWMKWVALVALFAFLSADAISSPVIKMMQRSKHRFDQRPSSSPPAKQFTQLLDHFNPLITDTWQQRYTVNDSFWQPGGPVFFFLAGEAPMEFFEFQEVSALSWAKDYGALYVVLEHRFYGQSFPKPDMSSESLQYLSSQQALADAANFLQWFNSTLNNPGPWVVFGCSYSGALSAWFRLKYPHLVVASVAPSGPVLAQTNFSGYLEQFKRSADPACVNAASQASQQINTMTQTTSGRQQLSTLFKSCQPLQASDMYFFLYSIVDALGGSDQMNNPPDWILNSTCALLQQDSNYVKNWGTIVSQQNGGTCNDFSESNFITAMRDLSIGPNSSGRAWYWQSCVEFGFFQSSYPPASIFPLVPVEPQVEWCAAIYDIPNMAPNTQWTNTYYGAMNLQATNVLFTNGLLDPWHLLSINQNLPSGVQAVTYEAGHCGTMIAPTSVDPPTLTKARAVVKQFLGKVLAQTKQ